MNILIGKLREYGADIEGTMERFLDDEELYVMCFSSFLEDVGFAGIILSVEKKNYMEAFEFAHALKGVAGNLGLLPLYHTLSELVEKLRNKEYGELSESIDALTQSYEEIKALKKYV